MRLILASRSLRRQQLLAQLGLEFDIVEADVDESIIGNESPAEMTMRLAALKAQSVYDRLGRGCRVLGGDTTVALANIILGKPDNRAEAIGMLHKLSGRTHCVFSAVARVDDSGCRRLLSETRVTFAELSTAQISNYCDTADPYDKAGAYGIQGEAGSFVSRLEGSYSGVMGLPLWQTHQLLLLNDCG